MGALLDDGVAAKLQVGDKLGVTEDDAACAEHWRERVREMPLISTDELTTSVLLRRAHLVLAFLQQFYVQSLPPHVSPIIIPRSIAIPILRVSQNLGLPPILTYSDTVLYNWHVDPTRGGPTDTENEGLPTPQNVRTHTMFTNTVDEEEFYLCSARIELRGVEALELMRMTMDETFVGDSIAIRRISEYLKRMMSVIDDLRILLLDVKKLCQPDVYYNEVRPWFRGQDTDKGNRRWVFEGVDEDPSLEQPTELSGPSAAKASATSRLPSFMNRMQIYMPKNHRTFLNHLDANPRPLRTFVLASQDEEMKEAYNRAVMALKEFRDAHMIITALYVIGPARRAARAAMEQLKAVNVDSNVGLVGGAKKDEAKDDTLRGTGGTDLVKFLKDTRTRTTEAVIKQ
ncbi:hypothetical protein D9756_003644 [Leucocoprinus leucothites]|uniref:Indoleamine 2,3-dioxygenase n=1 Tax=Leucocoprinus leucothites TaxID=201217 RepID=A0A8H5G6S8_9AGAR|nr:hypothetical protein D9756_003644 [Leucoagaricus leucothites]